MNMPVL